MRGQVDTLLVVPQAAADLTVDLAAHPGLVLPAAGTDHRLPADQALVAAAVTTAAQVRVAPSAALGGTPAAALRRWDQDTSST